MEEVDAAATVTAPATDGNATTGVIATNGSTEELSAVVAAGDTADVDTTAAAVERMVADDTAAVDLALSEDVNDAEGGVSDGAS